MTGFSVTLKSLLVLAAFAGLGACAPPGTRSDQDTPYLATAMGYARTPEIVEVQVTEALQLQVRGIANPQGRVRLVNASGQAIGVTADGEGRFTADVPQGPEGSLYTVFMENGGRQIQAQGSLFVPRQASATRDPGAVYVRDGAGSLPLSARAGLLAALDYDAGGGMAVSGRSLPDVVIEVAVNGEAVARTRTDDLGLYSALIPPGSRSIGSRFQLSVRRGSDSETRQVTLKAPLNARIEPDEGLWYLHRSLPGGGGQSTIVF